MELKPNETAHGFRISSREELPEIDGEAYVGVHEASGARLLYLKNDDNNKSFAIGFRTPPQDDTGVFHILEHSVLCGSRRFPVKEPFVDLLKGSMQTFLNAMTFADKTLYPVASTNEQDLFNLMDVYLDAVFHPRIYEKRAIFEQEGWHYELVAADGAAGDAAQLDADQTALVHNGVVFNEMKGALSDSSSVLYDELQKALFPDTCYAFESGGTPESIPTLTYENYLDEHRRHYRTDNSYIVLYGNLDIDRALAFLDERYLTPVAAEQEEADAERAAAGLEPLRPREITHQDPVAPGYIRTTMDTAPENAVAGCAYVIGDSSDRLRATAAEILLDALLGSNEAPLKRALLDAGVGHDIQAFVSDSLLQPFAVVQVNMPAEGAGPDLAETIAKAARDMLDAGMDKELVRAALAHDEFVMREHELGYADGVVNAMMSLASWLYDDDMPIEYLKYERAYAQLRSELEGDYFERLCEDLFCNSAHMASVEVVPTPGESDDTWPERLAAMNRELSADERARIVEEEAVLREMQEAPDSPEAIATLPRLGVSDIGDAPEYPAFDLDADAPIKCLRHSVRTHGITYAYRYFDARRLSFEDIPYLTILGSVLGKLGTAHHTAAEIDTLVQGKLGNLNYMFESYEQRDDPEDIVPMFTISASALSDNAEWLATLPVEIMTESDFNDTDKILDVLKQRKIGMEQMFASSGHSCAAARCKSYYTRNGVLMEQASNVGYYRFLCDLLDNFEARKGELSARLRDVSNRLFRDDGCLMSFAGTDDDYRRFWEAKPLTGLTGATGTQLAVPEPVVRNEAFVVPSDVCYVGLGWDRRLLDVDHSASWAVTARALSLDYLWNEVRVKGGAYGVGFQVLRSGNMRFYSYRDPHLDETLARFAQACDWLAAFDPSQEELEGFIVATVAHIDAPTKPRLMIRKQVVHYLTHHTVEEMAKSRRDVIATDVETMRSHADTLRRIVDANAICVFGNRDIIESSKADLEVIDLIG